jgi:hypothetical protein
MSPVGATPLLEVHFNAQNNNKKVWWQEIQKKFQGKWKK